MTDNLTNIETICLNKLNEMDMKLNSLKTQESQLKNQLLIAKRRARQDQLEYLSYSDIIYNISVILLVLKNQDSSGKRKDFFPELDCSDYFSSESKQEIEDLINTKYEDIMQRTLDIESLKKNIEFLKLTNSTDLTEDIKILERKIQTIQIVTNINPSQMHNLGKIKTFFQQNRDKIEEVENILKS